MKSVVQTLVVFFTFLVHFLCSAVTVQLEYFDPVNYISLFFGL